MHQEVLNFNKHLLKALLPFSVDFSLPSGLLDKLIKHVVPHVISMLLHIVIVEATVLLRLDVLVSISDMGRVDPVWAVLAGESQPLLIKGQALSLEPNKGVFPGGVHEIKYLFNN